tara:strand:+ start:9 stop:665 length:657 start_codon:yes stop_codon:yes gene_type:complete
MSLSQGSIPSYLGFSFWSIAAVVMKVLVACEYSGVVRSAFATLGHDAWSCDILPTDIEGNHYQGDVSNILDQGWDLMIAHPPCQYLSVSGNRWMNEQPDRQQHRDKALDFVRLLMAAPIEKIAIENPISVISSQIRKPDQIIQPYMFGHQARKTTCLWLKGLPLLVPTDIVGQGEIHTTKSGKRIPKWYNLPPSKDRSKIRSKTFEGIAAAMASQWSI